MVSVGTEHRCSINSCHQGAPEDRGCVGSAECLLELTLQIRKVVGCQLCAETVEGERKGRGEPFGRDSELSEKTNHDRSRKDGFHPRREPRLGRLDVWTGAFEGALKDWLQRKGSNLQPIG